MICRIRLILQCKPIFQSFQQFSRYIVASVLLVEEAFLTSENNHLMSIVMFALHLIRSKHNYVEYIINHVYNLLIYVPVFLNTISLKYDTQVFKIYI